MKIIPRIPELNDKLILKSKFTIFVVVMNYDKLSLSKQHFYLGQFVVRLILTGIIRLSGSWALHVDLIRVTLH